MQNQKNKRKQSLRRLYKLTLPSGQVRYKAYLGRIHGKQKFKLFEEYDEAVTYLNKLEIATANEGQQLWSLTRDCQKPPLPPREVRDRVWQTPTR